MTKGKGKYFVESDRLNGLRQLAATWSDLNKVIGGAVQFRLVVDTNVVLGDIRWLATKRKNPDARTALIETISAGTIEVFVPPSLHAEVDEHIERISAEEGFDSSTLKAVWADYQKKLVVVEPDGQSVDRYKDSVDPDDAAFVVLADMIGAAGIVSNDAHIAKMGGNRISVDCVLSLRDYSRATAIELQIKYAGVMVGFLSINAIIGLIKGIKGIIAGVAKAPDWLKLALIGGAIFCIVHPGARARVLMTLRAATAGIKEISPHIFGLLEEAVTEAQKHQAIAKPHLDKALEQLGPIGSKTERLERG